MPDRIVIGDITREIPTVGVVTLELSLDISITGFQPATPPSSPPTPPDLPFAHLEGTGAPVLPSHVAGNTLVVVCVFISNPGNLQASGWTRRTAISGGCIVYIYTKEAASNSETFVLGANPDTYTTIAFEGDTDFDAVANGTINVGSVDCIAPSVTATADDYLISVYAAGVVAAGITVPVGQDALPQVSGMSTMHRVAWEEVSAGATGTRTATLSLAQNSIAVNLAIKKPV